jgi:hypothetical protein
MFSLSFSRQLLVRRTRTSLGSRGALPLGTGRMLRRTIMSEAQLTPLEDLSEPRQRLRRVLDDYRHKKYVSGREGDDERLSVGLSLFFGARALFHTANPFPVLDSSLTFHFHFFTGTTDSFGQTLFSRFLKEMIVVTDANQDGKISMKEMRNMLKNIGADERDISQQDLEAVFAELGHEEDGESLIDCDEVEEILMGTHA